MKPILLPANQPPARFYKGGARIAEFRGGGEPQPNTPEDWVGSTTSVRGHAPVGMTRLDDGRLLADAIASDPREWLGPEHVARYGDDCMLLVKLLDAGQRLPVHAHPDGEFAQTHVSTLHGKAEAWLRANGWWDEAKVTVPEEIIPAHDTIDEDALHAFIFSHRFDTDVPDELPDVVYNRKETYAIKVTKEEQYEY